MSLETREAQEAFIRSVTRTCRGGFVLAEDTRVQLRNDLQKHIDALDFAGAVRLMVSLEDSFCMSHVTVQDGEWDTVVSRVMSLAYSRKNNCGFDFNNTICEGPFDGQEHDYTCLNCGATGCYIAPKF